jgi:hypothetical protein
MLDSISEHFSMKPPSLKRVRFYLPNAVLSERSQKT